MRRRALPILIAALAVSVAGGGRLAMASVAGDDETPVVATPAPPPVTQAAVVPVAPPVPVPTPAFTPPVATPTFPTYTPRAASRSTYRPTIRSTPSTPKATAKPRVTQRPTTTTVVTSGDPKSIAKAKLAARGWSSQFSCLDNLWTRESGWRTTAANPSGAYGIPQALPGSKMASEGSDWRTNPATQIEWGLKYIAAQYGTPCGAWSHFQSAGSC